MKTIVLFIVFALSSCSIEIKLNDDKKDCQPNTNCCPQNYFIPYPCPINADKYDGSDSSFIINTAIGIVCIGKDCPDSGFVFVGSKFDNPCNRLLIKLRKNDPIPVVYDKIYLSGTTIPICCINAIYPRS